MRRKSMVLVLVMVFVFLLSGTCLSADKPFGEINSTQEAIDKLFAGRTLDPIEGIWVKIEDWEIAIVKTSIINPTDEKLKKYDYLPIKLSGQNKGEIWEEQGIKRTRYDFLFRTQYQPFKLLSPTLLQDPQQSLVPYTRIYPAP